MDKEKLNKAAIIAVANYDNPFDEPAYDKKFYDGFMAGTDWLMQQPLSERLSETEREKIREEYNLYKDSWNETELTETTMESFVEIFGADLFKEK